MIDDLRARFLPRFVAASRARLARSRGLTAPASADPGTLAKELHAMAGEAALIGFPDLADLARATEISARAWASGHADAAERCRRNLAELEVAVEALALAQSG
ncbi:MAG TPA: Hpt domain-containing protein [Polyangia bacterium]|nr:Hpt domain-containing protein [Polyangia bacterium]